MKYSKLLFNWWDWTMNNYSDCNNLNASNSTELKTLLYEDNIKSIIENRTLQEKVQLFARRTILLIVNIVILAIGWVGIAAIYFYQENMKTSLSEIAFLSSIAVFIPGMVIACINFLVPNMSMAITAWEKWDYTSEQVKRDVWKQFLALILNIVIICAISVEFLYRAAYFGNTSIMTQSTNYSCREDQIGTLFFNLTISNFVISILAPEIVNWLIYIANMKKAVFLVSAEAVALLFFQVLVW
eukprot:TRINITY_DN16373_c0_g1_i1.p1 TRINITY_DN16373_c0_g1~~TRINITY_DN16373_c0_g1_i1.p1  ORF type:complete len:242 (-),score=31.81 TRINITY_DN16373_c0_g1_i1:420-1145(-)